MSLSDNSRILRKNMTAEERHLWYDFLRGLNVTVNRQRVIGPYIVDFYCSCARLVIEIDGSQHYEDKGLMDDAVRDAYLSSLGLNVIRYSNHDLNRNFSVVCEDILGKIRQFGNQQVFYEGEI